MTTIDLIKADQETKFREEIKMISYRLLTSMSYLNLADDERTTDLYVKLDKALVEVLELEQSLG